MQILSARPADDVVAQRLQDTTVVVQLQTSRIHELNHTGSRFWELLEQQEELAQIEQQLLAEFDVPADQLHEEVQRLASQLADEQLITIIASA